MTRFRRIGIITYDHPHLKTEQVVHALLRRGYELKIYALPFVSRKKREVVIRHRPDQETGVHPRLMALDRGIEFVPCEEDTGIDGSCDVYHVLAGRILSAGCVAGKRIINCHPGVIPAVRGLDAFKWAIHMRCPLGITLHFIDAEVDRGEVLSIVRTDVYPTDTIESLARRHYENEIDVTADFERYMVEPVNQLPGMPPGPQRMRMKRETEREVVRSFPGYVESTASGFRGAVSSVPSAGQEP